MDTTYRVAARYKMSVFIPDKIWREGKARAKATMAMTLTDRSPAGLRYELMDRFRVLYMKFIQQLKDFGLPPELDSSLDFRLDTVLSIIQKIADSAFEFQKQYGEALAYGYDKSSPTVLERLEAAIAGEITDYYSESVVRIGDGLKATWHTDKNLIKALAQRLLKKATPEEQQSIEEASTLLTTRTIDTKYKFFDRVNLKGLSRKLVTKQKIDYDFLRWFDFLRDVVSVNYGTGNNRETNFRNFDLHGMKIVVDDNTVDDNDIKLYIRYLDETHAKMKAKGFESAWYGTVLIECASCGGVNYNTGGGTGGNYTIGTDVVRVFSRPTRFIVELVSHELGHRYWFRQMTETQRERFKALIRVKPRGVRPDSTNIKSERLVPNRVFSATQKVDEAGQKVHDLLSEFQSSRFRWHRKIIDAFDVKFQQAGWAFWQEMLDAMHSAGADATLTPEVKAVFDAALDANGKTRRYLDGMDETITKAIHDVTAYPDPDGTDWIKAFKIEQAKWVQEAERLLKASVAAAHKYIGIAVQAYNDDQDTRAERLQKKWDEEYANDKRPVEPVSDYGKSNIDEAFAEVFAHYIMGEDMTRDQIESFKSILKTAAERVLDRVESPYTLTYAR